ncbi:hypothetical protein CJF30_00003193 [Rutstroemia sp. NJR-2017a BBW]|nr:hypothetical protein CJF30_00003193 [Rutstroemia sp. NJR-2017a BBW]
MKLAEK